MNINTRSVKGGLAIFGMALALIAHFEGKSNTVYPDPVDISTVCYGHVLTVNDENRMYTDEECLSFLEQDIEMAEHTIDRYVTVDLSYNQKEALVSFVYNVGAGNFKRSTLLRKLNRGDYTGACNELPRWIYSKGRKLNGLIKRREAERLLCLS